MRQLCKIILVRCFDLTQASFRYSLDAEFTAVMASLPSNYKRILMANVTSKQVENGSIMGQMFAYTNRPASTTQTHKNHSFFSLIQFSCIVFPHKKKHVPVCLCSVQSAMCIQQLVIFSAFNGMTKKPFSL